MVLEVLKNGLVCSSVSVLEVSNLCGAWILGVCHLNVLGSPSPPADEDGWRVEQRDGSEASLEWSSDRQDIAVISDTYFPRYFVAPGE